MTNRKVIVISILVLAVVAFSGLYLSKTSQNDHAEGLPNTAADTANGLGVIDMNQAIKAHPRYQELTELKKARSLLAANAENTKNFQVNNSPSAADLSAIDTALQQKRNQQLGEKHRELSERLKKKEQELSAQFSAPHEAALKEIDAVYLPQIFNLQLKLDTLKVTPEVGQEMLSKVSALKAEHSQKIREVQQNFFVQIGGMMKEEQAKATQELDAYAAMLNQELSNEARKKQGEIEVRNHLAMTEKTNELKLGMQNSANMQQALIDKEQEASALQDLIIKDISAKVAKIALEKNLSTVLAKVQSNISALELTDLVIAEFKK